MRFKKGVFVFFVLGALLFSQNIIAKDKLLYFGVTGNFYLVLSESKRGDVGTNIMSATNIGAFTELNPMGGLVFQARALYTRFGYDGTIKTIEVQEDIDAVARIIQLSLNMGYNLMLIEDVDVFVLGGYGTQFGKSKEQVSRRIAFGDGPAGAALPGEKRFIKISDKYWFWETGLKIKFANKKVFYALIFSYKVNNVFDFVQNIKVVGNMNVGLSVKF